MPAAEAGEERGLGKGNVASNTRPGLRAGQDAPSALDRVRRVARQDKEARFTALLHHVDIDRLRAAYWALKPKAAPGVDGVTWADYGQDLEANLRDLHSRVNRGGYRARPSRRVYIPTADGRQRPLGVAALEDKLLQRAVVEVLNTIYETDFRGFSYGFRPGRSPHHAVDALAVGVLSEKVNWVLDADIRGFYDAIEHGWMLKFLEHRIADGRMLRLIRKWLKAGMIENGIRSDTVEGTAQGASASPLLSNVYLHHVFDLWADQWRRRHAHGDMIVVRFADDCVPRTRKEELSRSSVRRMWCCTRDEGARPLVWWPFAAALQGEVVNHREVRRSRAGVLSVAEKARYQRVRCGSRRRARAIPPLRCRKRIGGIRNRGRVIAPGLAWREPAYWPGGCPAWMVARV